MSVVPRPKREAVTGSYFVAAYPPFSCWQPAQVPALEEALGRPAPTAPLGLYVHLPFCQKKCDYCCYLSYTGQPAAVIDDYLDAVVAELSLYAGHPAIAGRDVRFVYFGGGTPSTLSTDQVERLLAGLKSALPWTGVEEVTFECAPRSVRREFLETLVKNGVTRLSMGVQSFDNALLQLNGRIHLAEDVERAYEMIRDAGFKWINLDLMVGLIGETVAQWHDSVRRAIQLGPESVTIYQTEIPHSTRLYRDFSAGRLPAKPVSWEIKRIRLDWAFEELVQAGYTIVSAYTAVKDPVRHRFLYQDHLWRGGDMLGLGVAAFGYVGGVHCQNEATLEQYEARVAAGRLPVKRAHRLTPREQLVREFILQLKLGAVPSAPFRERFGVELARVFAGPLRSLAERGFLTCSSDGVQLTRHGLLRVDRLLPEFYAPQFRDVRYS